jgi:hypothetical protein
VEVEGEEKSRSKVVSLSAFKVKPNHHAKRPRTVRPQARALHNSLVALQRRPSFYAGDQLKNTLPVCISPCFKTSYGVELC